MDNEKRTALETEVAEVIGVLFDTLSEERLSEGGGAAVAEGIGCYVQQVERVSLAAEAAGFMALRDLCILFQEMLTGLGDQGRPLTEDERMLLEEWPALVIGYMESAGDPQAGEALIQHLQSPVWNTPLDAADAETLKSFLMQPPAVELAPTPSPVAEVATAADNQELAVEPVGEATEDLSATTVEAEPMEIVAAVPVADADLTDSAPLEEEPALAEAQETAFAETNADPSATVEAEARVIQPTALPTTVEVPVEAAATPVEEIVPVQEEQEVFAESVAAPVPDSAREDLVEPVVEAVTEPVTEPVVETIMEQAVSAPLPEFLSEPLTAAEEAQVAESASVDSTQAAEAIEATAPGSLEEEVARLLDILFAQFAESGPANDSAGASGRAVADNVGHYAHQVERVGMAAGAADFIGLQNICVLFQEALLNLSAQQRLLTAKENDLLEQWPTLVMGYLESPHEVEPSHALLENLQDPAWNVALTEDELNLLRNMLGIPSEEPVMESADRPAAEAPPGEEPAYQASVTMPTVPAIPGAVDEEDWAPDSAELETDEEETSLEAAADEEDADAESASAGALPAAELVEILEAEVNQLQDSAAETLDPLMAADGDPQTRREALTSYAEELQRLADAAEAVGMAGLHDVCAQIDANLLHFAAQERAITAGERDLLGRWPALFLAYLHALNDRAVSRNLADYLRDPQWPIPLPAEDAAALANQLVAPTAAIAEAVEVEARPHQARAEDVTLQLPEDVNPELLDSLLQELPSQTADFSAAIQRMIDGEGTLDDVDVAQRIAHTLKGAGNTVGVRGIANLTHHMEDILRALAKYKTLPNRPLAETLMSAADCLENMSEALIGMSDPPTQAQQVLQEILDWANRIDREGVPSGEQTVETRPIKEVPLAATAETTAPAKAAQEVATTPMLRVPATLVDDLLRLVGESIILTGQIQEQARKAVLHSRAVHTQSLVFQQVAAELEQLVDVRGVASSLTPSTVRGESDFDPLELEQYNELNSLTHRLLEVGVDARELSQDVRDDLTVLDNLLIDQGRLHRQSQEAVLRTRMVPVKTIVPRLQRSVRQTCRLTDKAVELHVRGEDTLIDSNVLTDMTDPLMHVLRNAVDHGVESPEMRRSMGKDPTGRIELSFVREGNTVVMRCQDDGAGLDLDKIRRTAEQKGLIRPDETLEESELSRLILTPGFSTRAGVTQTSGRGIGLDVVYTSLQAIKGTFHVKSKLGQGCLVELRLPVTLISTHALLVRARQQLYAISNRGVEQILYSGVGEIRRLGASTTYQLGNDIYELTSLEELLDFPYDRRSRERDVRPLLLVRDEAGVTRAVLVQEIADSRDLVVKSMGHYIPPLRGVVGATILGDGSVVPVLDLPDLLRVPVRTLLAPAAEMPSQAQGVADQRRRVALVVDDSLSARRSLAQFVEDAGFEVRTARDGLEAASIIDSKQPDLLLVDLEMPRMNGLELTAHIRARDATRDLPVIMITSRSTAKHIEEAKTAGVNFYMTKPFAEEELLKNIQTALGNG